MLANIHHIQLAMPAGGEHEARTFYRDLFGLEEKEKPDELKKRGGCWFEDGSLRVHLGVDENFIPARKAHPCFQVQEFEVLREKLQTAGLETTNAGSIDGLSRFFVNDPFGNRIEIMALG